MQQFNSDLAPYVCPWRVRPLLNATDLQNFAAELRERLAVVELNHDLEWLKAGLGPHEEILVFAAGGDSGPTGAMPLRVAPGKIQYTLGRFRLFSKAVHQVNLVQGPLTKAGDRRAALLEALECLSATIPSNGVVFASAVPCDSDFHALLEERDSPLRKCFRIFKWGDPNWHCKIDWTGRVEDYLATLGADSRRNFKRYAKKLFANQDLQAVVERFRSSAEVDRFMTDGIAVSDKTYQKTELGLGLERGGATERRFRFAAARDGFLGHILYLRGKPVAFHYGFIFGETFFVVQMGYDPAYAQHQPGAVLFFRVLQDVERLGLPVKTIDCLPGVTDFKLRTTNRKERIQNYYFFPRSLSGSATFAILSAVDAVARAMKPYLKRDAGRIQRSDASAPR